MVKLVNPLHILWQDVGLTPETSEQRIFKRCSSPERSLEMHHRCWGGLTWPYILGRSRRILPITENLHVNWVYSRLDRVPKLVLKIRRVLENCERSWRRKIDREYCSGSIWIPEKSVVLPQLDKVLLLTDAPGPTLLQDWPRTKAKTKRSWSYPGEFTWQTCGPWRCFGVCQSVIVAMVTSVASPL